jgi:hypothetical protein
MSLEPHDMEKTHYVIRMQHDMEKTWNVNHMNFEPMLLAGTWHDHYL